jgi:hypothetical protein
MCAQSTLMLTISIVIGAGNYFAWLMAVLNAGACLYLYREDVAETAKVNKIIEEAEAKHRG